jgi:hypothetical protein
MNIIIPDLKWYLKQSKKDFPRCQFANANRCPRYFQSLSLLGSAGTTKLSEKEDRKLSRIWKKSPLWPKTDEQATSISGPEGNYKHYWNFCPEISFERFGFFASHLDKYADEADIGSAHLSLSRINASPEDWRWSWANILPQHYTHCDLYSLLLLSTQEKHDDKEVIMVKPNFYGIGIDIKALFKKMKDLFN